MCGLRDQTQHAVFSGLLKSTSRCYIGLPTHMGIGEQI